MASMMGSKIAEKIKRSYPDMKPAVDYGKSFKAGFDSKFHGGDHEPDQVDISYYGTVAPLARWRWRWRYLCVHGGLDAPR